jgi:hypothetical protein
MEEKTEYEAWGDVSDGLLRCPKNMAEAIESFLRERGHDTIRAYLDARGSPKALQAMFKKTPDATFEFTPASEIITNDAARLAELRGIEYRHAEQLATRLLTG